MQSAEFRRHAHALVDWIADYLDGAGDYPVTPRLQPGDVLAQLPAAVPDAPEAFETIFADFERVILPGMTHWQHPDFFAAGFISALAYQSEYISDEQLQRIAKLPIWFVHSADDQTTQAKLTVLPVYERLKAAGARNVHLSYYDNVVDVTGFFGGDGYRYNGHWSWVYLHANQCRLDRDGSPVRLGGRPVSIMEWLSAQSNGR